MAARLAPLLFLLLPCLSEAAALGQSRRVVVTFHSAAAASGAHNISLPATVVKQYGRRLVLDLNRPVDLQADSDTLARDIGPALVQSVELDSLVAVSVVERITTADSIKMQGASSDVSYANIFQWNLADSEPHSIHAEKMWKVTNSSPSVVVAVLDSGLAAQAKAAFLHLGQGYDFVSDESMSLDGDGRDADSVDPGDAGPDCPAPTWHGTKVASILGAGHILPMGLGMRGVAQNCTVMPVRVLGLCSSGYSNDVADAVVYSAGGAIDGLVTNPTPANIISMSISGLASECPSYLQSAITQAISLGALVVAAAGNKGLPDVLGTFPSNCKGVISVGANTRGGSLASYSNGGATMLAPGGDWTDPIAVLSVSSTGQLILSNSMGTSMSAPHVAGAAAILASFNSQPPGMMLYSLNGTVFMSEANQSDQVYDLAKVLMKGVLNQSNGTIFTFQGFEVKSNEVTYYESNTFINDCQELWSCGIGGYNAVANQYPCGVRRYTTTSECHPDTVLYLELGGSDSCGQWYNWGCFCREGYAKQSTSYSKPDCGPACPRGTYSAVGAQDCTLCPAGTYSGRSGVGACATCTPAGFFCTGAFAYPTECTDTTKYCPLGTSSEISCQTCSTTTQYQTSDCTRTADRQCSSCRSACHSTTEYQTTACNGVTNRQCATCKPACTGETYQKASTCNGVKDRECLNCKAACSGDTYQKANTCNGVVDRQCVACTVCSATQYQTRGCRTSTSLDRTCSTCKICTPGQYQTQACVGTTDRMCADCPVGTYDMGNRTCKACANALSGQYYTSVKVAASSCPVANCTSATAGQYYSGAAGSNLTACQTSQCPKGTRSDGTTAYGVPYGKCATCDYGTYGPSSGLSSCLDCLSTIPFNSQYVPNAETCNFTCYYPANSIVSDPATCSYLCSAGFRRNSTAGCEPCPVGTFRSSSLGQDGSCDACTLSVSMPPRYAVIRKTTQNTQCDWECYPPPDHASMPAVMAAMSCDWQCNAGYTPDVGGTSCVDTAAHFQASTSTSAALTTTLAVGTTTAALTTELATTADATSAQTTSVFAMTSTANPATTSTANPATTSTANPAATSTSSPATASTSSPPTTTSRSTTATSPATTPAPLAFAIVFHLRVQIVGGTQELANRYLQIISDMIPGTTSRAVRASFQAPQPAQQASRRRRLLADQQEAILVLTVEVFSTADASSTTTFLKSVNFQNSLSNACQYANPPLPSAVVLLDTFSYVGLTVAAQTTSTAVTTETPAPPSDPPSAPQDVITIYEPSSAAGRARPSHTVAAIFACAPLIFFSKFIK